MPVVYQVIDVVLLDTQLIYYFIILLGLLLSTCMYTGKSFIYYFCKIRRKFGNKITKTLENFIGRTNYAL